MEEKAHLKLITNQMENIRNGLRSLVYFRELAKHTQPDHKFWISTKNSHLAVFALAFAKVFGSKKTEQLHWKKAVSKDQHTAFRQSLKVELQLSNSELKNYVNRMLGLRNSLIAHRDLTDDLIDVPEFSTALSAMKFLYEELREMPAHYREVLVVDHGPGSIEVWLENLEEDAANYINRAVSGTEALEEHR